MLKYFILGTISFLAFTGNLLAGKLYNYGGSCVGTGYDSCSIIKNNLYTYDSVFSITGNSIPGTSYVSFTYNNEGEYFLRRFDSNAGFFVYNISPKNKNLIDGLNVYHARFYDKNKNLLGKEYIYEVMFFDKNKKSTFSIKQGLEPTTENEMVEQNISEPIFYYDSGKSNTKILRLTKHFGDYILDLGSGYKLIYTAFYDKNRENSGNPWNAKLKITYKNPKTKILKESNEIFDIDFSASQFNNPSITKFTNNYFLIETGAGHEGVSTAFVFSPKKMKIINLFELEKKIIGLDAYPVFSVSINNSQVILDEFKYCCDQINNPGGYETIILDIDKEKLISRSKK